MDSLYGYLGPSIEDSFYVISPTQEVPKTCEVVLIDPRVTKYLVPSNVSHLVMSEETVILRERDEDKFEHVYTMEPTLIPKTRNVTVTVSTGKIPKFSNVDLESLSLITGYEFDERYTPQPNWIVMGGVRVPRSLITGPTGPMGHHLQKPILDLSHLTVSEMYVAYSRYIILYPKGLKKLGYSSQTIDHNDLPELPEIEEIYFSFNESDPDLCARLFKTYPTTLRTVRYKDKVYGDTDLFSILS